MSDPQGWLVSRLTPVKQKIARWVDFASAVQKYWEDNFDPHLRELEKAKSIYTSTDETLAQRLSDLGDMYPVDSLVGGEDKTLAVAWRKMALLFKDARYMMDSTLQRKFGSLGVKWVELYAPKAFPYGNEFVGMDRILSKKRNPDGFFLTCHGSVNVELETLANLEIPIADFVDQAWDEVQRIRPAHIVFRGVQIFSEIRTTIRIGSFVKDGEYIKIKADLFDLKFDTINLRQFSFVRTAEVIKIAATGGS